MQGDNAKKGILDVDLFPSGMKPTTGDKLNLSPRLSRAGKEPSGSLRGDTKPKDGEEKKSRNPAGSGSKSLEKGLGNGSSHDSDSFFRMYNQEIKINQDEIPIILAELTDAAYNFITREQFEKALILLQKTEGVLECVSLQDCQRDKFVTFITYNNMAMCFQKLNMLEECLTYLKESIKIVQSEDFLKGGTVSLRMKKIKHECKLKLQLCAILSQTQQHTEAQNNALSAVKLCHQLFKDLDELCGIYSDKITYRDNLLAAQEQSDLDDEEREQYIAMILDSSPAKEIPKNFLEQSISLVERSSLKLAPVVKEVRKRMAGEPYVKDKVTVPRKDTSDMKITENKAKAEEAKDEAAQRPGTPASPDEEDDEPADMRSVLGFLNQQEWIANLNIGNIMQIQALQMKDFLNYNRDECELSRDSFLEKLSILTVSYFCMSTEMRFLLQLRGSLMKPTIKRDKELESEYWHAKALEMACTFLPSECPLLNHILLSYQKHHDPAKQPIREDEETTDMLSVLRPIKGIDQSKYQPIVRQLPISVKVSLSPSSVGVTNGLRTLLQTEERSLVARVLKNHLQTSSMSQAEKEKEKEKAAAAVSAKLKEESKHSQQIKTSPADDSTSSPMPLMPETQPQDLIRDNPHLIPVVISQHEQDSVSGPQSDGHSGSKGQFNIIDQAGEDFDATPDYRDEQSPVSSLHPSDEEKEKLDAALLAAAAQSHEDRNNNLKKGKSRDQPSGALNDISAISQKSNLHHLRSSSIEGLERQLMQVAESPPHESGSPQLAELTGLANVDWISAKQKEQIKEAMNMARRLRDQSLDEEKGSLVDDSLAPVDSILLENDGLDNRMYDAIISKLLENPRIDKKTLLNRFISKMELDSKEEVTRMSEEMANLKERTDNLQRQNISQQVPPSASGSMMLVPNSSTDMSQMSAKEEKKVRKHQESASVQQASRVKNRILPIAEDTPLSDGPGGLISSEKRPQKEDSVAQDRQKRKQGDVGILPQTRIRKRPQKTSTTDKVANAHNSVNTSKTSNLSKTTHQKTLQKEQARLLNTNTRPGSKMQAKRPGSRLVKAEGKVQGTKTRKIVSYIDRDQMLEGQSFDEESGDARRRAQFEKVKKDPVHFYADQEEDDQMVNVEDIELQEKSEQSRSRIDNQSILTMGDGGQGGNEMSRLEVRPDSAEKELAEEGDGQKNDQNMMQQLSSQKKSSNKTRPSSGITNFTRSSSNMKRRRRAAATSLVPGLSQGINASTIQNQYKRTRIQKTGPERAAAGKVDGSRSSSSQRRSKGSSNLRQTTTGKRQLKRASAPNTNSNSTAAVPVQKYLQEQSSVILSQQGPNANKENFSVIANTRGQLQGHQTSQQVLPPKARPISGNKTTGLRQKSTIMPPGQATSVFDSNQTGAQHNLSQQCLPSHKQNQLLGGSSQKRLRKLLGSKNSKIIDQQAMARASSGAAIPASGYKTAQPRASTIKQKSSAANYNSVAVAHNVANQLSSTKPRATQHHSSSQALGKNQLIAQLSHHLQLSSNQRGRSRKRKRVSGINAAPNLNSAQGMQPQKIQTRPPVLTRARSGGSYSHSTGRGTVSGSSASRTTTRRCFACSNSTSNKKRHQSSESHSRSNPRNKSSRSDQQLRYSSKRRSGNKTAQESKAHQLEFKKQPGGASLFNVVTQANNNFVHGGTDPNQQHQSSLCDLKRQVLANQKILLQEMSSQQQLHRVNRSNSSESKKRKRSYLAPPQQKNQPQSNQHLKQSLDILLRQSQQHNRAKSNKGGPMRLRVPPEKKGKGQEEVDDPRVFMSKSLHFMQSLAKKQQLVSQSQLLRHKASETQHNRKSNIGVDEADSSGANNRRQRLQSSGGRRSNSHERKQANKSQGRSQSPPQPNMARIPKKKQYAKLHTSSHAQIFREGHEGLGGNEPAAAIAMQGQLIASGGQHLGAPNQLSASNENIITNGQYNKILRQQASSQGHVQSQSLIHAPHDMVPGNDFEPVNNMGDFSHEDFEIMRQQVVQQAAARQYQKARQDKQYSSTTITREMHNQLKVRQERLGIGPHGTSDDQLDDSNFTAPTQQATAITKKDQRAKKLANQQVRMLAKKIGTKMPASQLVKQAYEPVQQIPLEGHDSTFGRQGAVDGRYQDVDSGFDELEDSPLRDMLEQQQEQLHIQQQQQQQQELHQQQKLYMR